MATRSGPLQGRSLQPPMCSTQQFSKRSMAQTRPMASHLQLLLILTALLVPVANATCDPNSSTINTQIKVDPGQASTSGTNCYFPFKSGGTTYTDCDGPYCASGYCNYWCATSCNYPIDSTWNYCKFRVADMAATNCSGLDSVAASSEPALLYGGSGNGSNCYFPFLHGGVCHYDCIVTSTEPWCATTDVQYHVSTNYKYCRYTLAGKNDPSCASIGSAAPYYLPQQVGNYSISGTLQNDPEGNCTFPFYYKEKCYDDCTSVDAHDWFLIWCSTEQYYLPNKKARICPYYRKYQSYTGLALSWGFYRIYLHDGCGSSGPFCNMSLAKAVSGVPNGGFGSPRMMLSSTTADVIEVMPQGNGYLILRLPLPCTTNFQTLTTDGSDGVYDYVGIEREFWNIKATATPNVFTVQSTWNASANHFLTRAAVSGFQVAKILSSPASEWRFEQLSNSELASLSLPCENPVNTSGTAVSGAWCSWSAYSYSGSVATRNRSCSCPSPSGGGANCTGDSVESGAMVNGTWCAWASSYTVNGAYGTRTRDCNCSAPANGGADCAGSGNDTGLVVNAGWCPWSSYSVSGAYATRTRNCSCPESAYGGSAVCAGSSNDTGLTVNGAWCAWTSSYTVNGAHGTRTRDCNCSAPAYAGADCAGSGNDTGLVVNGTWCAWSGYSVSGGYATRTRTCSCSAEAYGGLTCQGSGNDTGAVVDGSWCAWGAYTVASGLGTRSRNCSCPEPAYTGVTCPGSSTDTLAQVNGTWCSWASLESGYGVLTRSRICNCSAPNVIGQNCSGDATETYPCNVTSCQTTTPSAVDGAWCSWGAWVAGSVNSGVMTRTRSCACPAASGTGAACSGSSNEVGVCTLDGCRVIYAVPAEPGSTGSSFINSDTFNRLIIWCSVVAGSILVASIVGLVLLCRRVSSSDP